MPDAEATIVVQQESKQEITAPEQKLSDLIQETNGDIDKARAARQTWVNQLDKNFKWRKGMIDKPRPDVPFRGSSNLKYRRAEREIRKLKPQLVEAVMSPTHMVRFIPRNAKSVQSASKLESFYDYFFKFVMQDFMETVDECADCLLENGLVVAKVTQKHEVEMRTRSQSAKQYIAESMQILQALAQQQGAKPIQQWGDEEYIKAIMLKEGWDEDSAPHKERAQEILQQFKDAEDFISVVEDVEKYNDPYIGCIRDLTSVVVPTGATNIQESPYVCHEFLFTERELIANATENGGKYENVYELLEFLKDRLSKRKSSGAIDPESKSYQSAIERAEGLSPEGEVMGAIAVREVHRWIPRKLIKRFKGKFEGKSNVMVRAVITYAYDIPIDDCGPLRVIEEPYDHSRWPFRDARIFSGRRRFYSGEGVVQSIEPFEKEENISRNGAIDRTTIAMNPPVFYAEGSNLTPNSHRQIGQWHPVRGDPAQVAHAFQYPDLGSAFKADANDMEIVAQDMVGTTDLRSQLNYATAPTAQQVQEVTAPAQAIRGLIIRLWLNFWSGNYLDVFELHRQYMFSDTTKKSVSFPDAQNAGLIHELTPQDFQGEFIVLAGADITRMNPVLQAQNEFVAFQMLNQPQWAWLVNEYDSMYDFISSRVGPIKSKVWLKDKKLAEQSKEAFQHAQAKALVDKKASRSGRTPGVKNMPGASAGGFTAK